MSQESGPWAGASGYEYIFHAYRRGESIPSRQGLYIYSKKNFQGIWLPVYMGHGDLSVCCEDPDLLACIDAKGATHIQMRLCPSLEDREAELADILKLYRNAFAPEGCNVAVPKAEAGSPATPPEPGPAPAA